MDDRRPTIDDLEKARVTFRSHEPRDIFYRAATDLIAMALAGQGSVNLAEALAVLLQTWNRSYYRYRPVTAEHFELMEALLARHAQWIMAARERSIDSMGPTDEGQVAAIFEDFELPLGPVGAAKALHLLAPRFLPLWDRKIAESYSLALGPSGTNGGRYMRFAFITRQQGIAVGGDEALGRNIIKALDEYNYCHFTKKWI